MRPDGPDAEGRLWPTRFIDEAAPQGETDEAELRAQALMRKLSELPPLSSSQLGRIAGGIHERLSAPPPRRSGRLAYAAAAVALLLAGGLAGRRLSLGATRDGELLLVPAGVVVSVEAEAGAALIGPAEAHVSSTGTLELRRGRLAIRAIDRDRVVETPSVKITIRRGGVVEIGVESSQVTVAAYAGGASVAWHDAARTLELEGGTRLAGDRVAPIAGERPAEIERLMPVEAVAPVAPFVAVAPVIVSRPHRPVRLAVAHVARTPLAPLPAAAPSVSVPASVPVSVPASVPASASGSASVPASVPVPAQAPPPRPSALSEESRLLGEALRRLGPDHDPRSALGALDRYRVAFPQGRLRPEAERARVDALLQLSRRKPALALLDGITGSELGSGELRVVRGELRVEARRFRDAVADFDDVLHGSVGGALAERALYGRAIARVRSSDAEGGRRDFEAYLSRFPEGKYAPQARQALGK